MRMPCGLFSKEERWRTVCEVSLRAVKAKLFGGIKLYANRRLIVGYDDFRRLPLGGCLSVRECGAPIYREGEIGYLSKKFNPIAL